MNAPPRADSELCNYKGTHSIVLIGIADADYKLLYIDVGRGGRCSDGSVLNHCSFGRALDCGRLGLPPSKPLPGREKIMPYVIVADDAFAMRPNVMKAFIEPNLDIIERIHNSRLNRARRAIENVFGVMTARFQVLRQPIALDAEKTKKVALACCALHNYLLTTNQQEYAPHRTFDYYDADNELIEGEWRQEMPAGTLHPLEHSPIVTADAEEIQQEFAEYFVEEGELDWQYKHIT